MVHDNTRFAERQDPEGPNACRLWLLQARLFFPPQTCACSLSLPAPQRRRAAPSNKRPWAEMPARICLMYNGHMVPPGQAAPKSTQQILIIAGPNGAGKTTFAREFLIGEANCPRFVNADLLAAGLNPFQPERAEIQAGRLMLVMIRDIVSADESFAFETTLSGRIFARMIPVWRAQGYVVQLLFFRLTHPEKAIERVAQRVREGGHNVPEDVIRRRMLKGWRNFQEIHLPIVDEWVLYDSTETTPVVIERGCNPRPPGDTQMTAKDPSLIYATEEQKKTLSFAELGLIALKRAAIKARRRAIATQGYVATWRNGKMYRDTKV